MIPKAVVVQQYIGGEWVELIRLPFDEEQEPRTFEEIKDLIFDNDKISLWVISRNGKKESAIFKRDFGPVKLFVEDINEEDFGCSIVKPSRV